MNYFEKNTLMRFSLFFFFFLNYIIVLSGQKNEQQISISIYNKQSIDIFKTLIKYYQPTYLYYRYNKKS